MNASNNVRMVEYTITEDDSGAYGLIQFTAPKKSLELLKKKQKYEDF
jgi:ribosomal protein S6